MKTLIASLFALSLLGASAASADTVGVGLHVGDVGIHLGAGHHDRDHYRHDYHRRDNWHRGYRRCYWRHGYRHCYWR